MSANNPAVDNAPLLERMFFFEEVEDSYEVTEIHGKVPDWFRGTYYINGPAKFERSGLRYRHWLDGDGMVCSLRVTDSSVRFTNRFVQTKKMRDENAAGHALYRTFGTHFPGDRLKRGVMLEPPNNVAAYPFAGVLLAFGEQAQPYELDPETLETRREYDFDGRITEVSPFAAHAKFDVDSGNMVNFGVSFSANKPMLNVYEFDPTGKLLRRHREAIPYQHSNHDCMITPGYVVFYMAPLIMDFTRFWGEHVSVMDSLNWEPEKGSRLLVVPRGSGGGESFEVAIGDKYCLHLINSYETPSGALVIDVAELDAPAYPEYHPLPDMFQTVTSCRPVRYVVDLHSKTLVERKEMAYDRAPDFPSPLRHLLGRPYNDFWMLGISSMRKPGRKFFDELIHGDWNAGAVNDIYQVEKGQYLGGEPCPVTNPANPEESVVVNEMTDARTDQSSIVLFDALNVSKGPVARLVLKRKIHAGLHTSFKHL